MHTHSNPSKGGTKQSWHTQYLHTTSLCLLVECCPIIPRLYCHACMHVLYKMSLRQSYSYNLGRIDSRSGHATLYTAKVKPCAKQRSNCCTQTVQPSRYCRDSTDLNASVPNPAWTLVGTTNVPQSARSNWRVWLARLCSTMLAAIELQWAWAM